jgi:23S rRNA (guanine2445-N2)-methyltransferase / 23S rRNA (guanine2069-N7)-methyltransferase
MEATWDVQRDHAALLARVMRRVAEGGTLVFSTNARKFRLGSSVQERFAVEDITRQTVPDDFSRGAPPHRCWLIRHRKQ